eukprot:EC714073.1.p2 GENE.EC714073.1~~EC714073.1.p2  ORF type:complete len:128 (+),score=29.38 EC714073.1:35-418(+)
MSKMSAEDAQAFMVQAQKTFNELRSKQADLGRQVQQIRAQIAGNEREKKRANLTLTEIDSLPKNTKTYASVGRMFLLSPREDVRQQLQKTFDSSSNELTALKKKAEYLEKQFTETTRNLQELKSALS